MLKAEDDIQQKVVAQCEHRDIKIHGVFGKGGRGELRSLSIVAPPRDLEENFLPDERNPFTNFNKK